MTNADVQKLLGSSWKIDSQAVVTSGNQTDYATDLTCSALIAKATPDKEMGQGYLPPVGWTVVIATDSSYNLETIWIDPSGAAWVLSKCTSFATSAEGANTPTTWQFAPGAQPQYQVSTAGGGSGLVLLLLGGALLWLLTKGK